MEKVTIRPALPQEYASLSVIPATVETSKTWQMEQLYEGGEWNIHFREVTLPRPLHLAYPMPSTKIREHLMSNELTLTAVTKSQLIGFLSLAAKDGAPAARVTNLVVATSNRRLGIATELLINAVDWLVERKFTGVTLEMMLKNHPCVSFANKLGFRLAGFNDVYYSNGQTAVFFYRKIA